MASNVVIDEFVTYLSYALDSKNLKTFLGGMGKAAEIATKTAATISGAIAGIAGSTALLNKETAKQVELAKSTGQSVDTIQAMASAVGTAGFNYEHIIDLAEELNNKIGESRGLEATNPVKESLKIIGLSFKNIEKLDPQKQFETITQALIDMTDAQKASSAADILFGGEGSRIFGLLNRSKQSLADIKKAHEAINLETKKSRKGAVEYSAVWGTFTKLLDSAKKSFAGLLGGKLTIYLTKLTEWIKLNKKLINNGIESAVGAIAGVFESLIRIVKQGYSIFSKLTNYINLSKGATLAIVAALWLLARHPVIFALTAIILVLDDLISYMNGAESVTASLIARFNQMPTSSKLGVFVAGIVTSIGVLYKAMKMLRITKVVMGFVVGLSRAFRILQVVLALVAGALSLPVAAIVGIGVAIAGLGFMLYKYWDDVKRISAGIWNAITGSLGKIPAYLSAIWTQIITAFSSIDIKLRIPTFNDAKAAILSLVKYVVSGFIRLNVYVFNAMLRLSVGVKSALVMVVGFFYRSFVSISTSIASFIINSINGFVRFKDQIVLKISQMVSSIVMWFATLSIRVGMSVGSLVNSIIQWFSTLTYRAGMIISNLVNLIVMGFANLAFKVGMSVSILTNSLISKFLSFKSSVIQAISNLVMTIITSFLTLGLKISSFIESIKLKFSQFASVVREMFGLMGAYLVSIFDSLVPDAARSMVGKITNAVSSALGSVREKVQALVKWANNIIGGITSSIGNIKGKLTGGFSNVVKFFKGDKEKSANSSRGKTINRPRTNTRNKTSNNSQVTNNTFNISSAKGLDSGQIRRAVGSELGRNGRKNRNSGSGSLGFGR